MSSGQHGGYFEDDRHAFYAGVVLMDLAMAGVPVMMVDDERGNHTNRIMIAGTKGPRELLIPPPPEGWTLAGDVG